MALDVFLQEAGLEIFKDPVAEKAKISRGEASPRNARDDIHLIRKTPPPAVANRGPALLRRRRGAAALSLLRKRKDEEKFFRVSGETML
jgi:hypothetical protein